MQRDRRARLKIERRDNAPKRDIDPQVTCMGR